MAAKKPKENPGEAEFVDLFHEKLKEAIAHLPPELVEKAREKAAEVAKTLDLDVLEKIDLAKFTPEKLAQMVEVGFNEFKLGRYDRAEKIFRGLTLIDSENYYYHQMLGATFQRQEKLAEAIVEYGIAVTINPHDTVSLTNRGECYFKSGVYPLAERDLDATIALDPEEKGEDRWINRARMLKKQIGMIKAKK